MAGKTFVIEEGKTEHKEKIITHYEKKGKTETPEKVAGPQPPKKDKK